VSSDLSNDISLSTGTTTTIVNYSSNLLEQDKEQNPILLLENSPKMRRNPSNQTVFKPKLR